MEISELIKELQNYDGELEIRVWSNNMNRSYKISHIGRGDDENGEMDTYISIVLNSEDGMPF